VDSTDDVLILQLDAETEKIVHQPEIFLPLVSSTLISLANDKQQLYNLTMQKLYTVSTVKMIKTLRF